MKLAAPAYCTEIAPPQWRGKMAGVLNCGYYGGSISAAAITFGTNYVNNDWCWRIPLIGQALPALVVIGALFFMPESPRWLMQIAQGRSDGIPREISWGNRTTVADDI
jgi:MFS family permease